MRVLVTGANGFVGRHIVETLLEAKHSVICAVRKTSNLRWVENLSVEYKYGDLNDKKFSETAVKDVDAVVHCAGIVRAMSMNEYFKANAENTKNLCEAVLKVSP